MRQIIKLLPFVKPYWKKSIISLLLLAAVVFMDLAIPRLVQKIIDQRTGQQNMDIVLQTSFSFGNLDRLQTGQLIVRLTSNAGVFQRLVQVSLRTGTRAPLLRPSQTG